jgi:hypothetical protein
MSSVLKLPKAHVPMSNRLMPRNKMVNHAIQHEYLLFTCYVDLLLFFTLTIPGTGESDQHERREEPGSILQHLLPHLAPPEPCSQCSQVDNFTSPSASSVTFCLDYALTIVNCIYGYHFHGNQSSKRYFTQITDNV